MISAVIIFVVLGFLSFWISGQLNQMFEKTDLSVFYKLIVWHFFIALIYYIYVHFNKSDSIYYYFKVSSFFRGQTWGDFYGVSTLFIEFLGFPLVHYLNLSYEAVMLVFAWFGLMGFFLFYIFLKEQISFNHPFLGFDLSTLILFLPNLHFWSSSFGKGSIIFFGFGLFFFALNNLSGRWIAGLLGAIIIYHVRPHILFVTLIAVAWGFVTSTKGIPLWVRIFMIFLTVVSIYFIKEDVLALTGIDEEKLVEDFNRLDRRAISLSTSGSGFDITQYSIAGKLFTFWFRPLFFDAPGIMGLIVSVENIFYIILFLKIIRIEFFGFLWRSDHVIKTSLLTFIGVSMALAQVTSNLGIAIRQKSQVMLLVLFVVLKFLDERQSKKEEADKKMKLIIQQRAAFIKRINSNT